MNQPNTDPKVYAKQRIAETRAELAWQAGPRDAMETWQDRLRAKLNEAIGGLPWERCPLNARVVETRDFGQYRRELIHFESRPGLIAVGYYLVPKDCQEKSPAVLCLPGHGCGVDSIVGIAADGSQRDFDKPDEYQADFALQCVAHGYPVFALEQVSFGHRRDVTACGDDAGSSSCNSDSMAALMLGETITGWRVWDAMRAIDYLETRPEVDPARIATMGISGGGLTSLFTACLDTRVRVGVVSGYFNTFRDSVLAVSHCVDNFVPGLLNLTEMPDMAGLIAPRALFVENGASCGVNS